LQKKFIKLSETCQVIRNLASYQKLGKLSETWQIIRFLSDTYIGISTFVHNYQKLVKL